MSINISELMKKIDFEALLNIANILDIDTNEQEDISFRDFDLVNEGFYSILREIIRNQFSDVESRVTRNQQGLSVSFKTEGLDELIQFANDHRFNTFSVNGMEETDGIREIKECINTLIIPSFANFNNGSSFLKRNGRIVFYLEYVNAYSDYALQLVSNGIFEMISYIEKIQGYSIGRLHELLEEFNAVAEEARQAELQRAAEREAQQRAIRDARIAREAQILEEQRRVREEAERVERERLEQERLAEEARQEAERQRREAEEATRARLRASGANDAGIDLAIQLGIIPDPRNSQ